MYSHALRYEEFTGTVYNNVRLCPRDQNSKCPPFPPTIAKIEYNFIAFCYINIIFSFVHSYILPYQDLKGGISTDVRPRKPGNIQNGVILAK